MSVLLKPGEPAHAFAALHRFIALGPGRSLDVLALELNITLSKLRSWSRRYNWRARVADHDLEVVRCEQEAQRQLIERRVADWAERQTEIREAEWQAALQLLEAARQVLDRDPSRWTFGDSIRAIDLASRLGRLAANLPLTPSPEPQTRDPCWQFSIEEALDRAFGPGTS